MDQPMPTNSGSTDYVTAYDYQKLADKNRVLENKITNLNDKNFTLQDDEALNQQEIILLRSALLSSTNELRCWHLKGGGKNSAFICARNLKLLEDYSE